VNTGEVVVRSIRKGDLHADYVPVGHSTNLAARMEQLAAPGSILVTAYTHNLTDGYFEFKALGQTQIKGVEDPLHVYEVLGAGPLRTRLQVSARRGLTRFVGRQSELEQLQHTLAQAQAGHGQIVGVMGEPLVVVGKTGERSDEAELYRLKGELTLQSKGPSLKSTGEEEAEACFHKAIVIAWRQQAKSLELRAVMSLARLWQQQGKKDEARQLLAEIYDWFTEGFDTKDLQEAKTSLEELS
jgi:hypothetical protein